MGQTASLTSVTLLMHFSRHVKINGSPVSLTENSAVFRKTDFKKKITDFQKSAHSLTVFFLLKAISCDNFAEVDEKNQYSRYRTLTIYNLFCEQNKMAEMFTRNKDTGDYVDASDLFSLGPS